MDERDLSRMVWGPTFLSLPAWRQVSEAGLQKRPPGRNLGEHRLVRSSGTTSRGTVALVFCWRMRNYPRTEVLRINRRRTVTLIVLTWCLGVAVAIKPLAKISVYTSNTYYNPIRPIKDITHSYEMNIALSLWGMVASVP